MRSIRRRSVSLAIAFLIPVSAIAQLKSIDEAEKLSTATGRPIFAVAGDET